MGEGTALDTSREMTPVSRRTAVAAGVVAVIWIPCENQLIIQY